MCVLHSVPPTPTPPHNIKVFPVVPSWILMFPQLYDSSGSILGFNHVCACLRFYLPSGNCPGIHSPCILWQSWRVYLWQKGRFQSHIISLVWLTNGMTSVCYATEAPAKYQTLKVQHHIDFRFIFQNWSWRESTGSTVTWLKADIHGPGMN